MEDPFIITVPYKGQDRDFEAELLQMGYTHKFHVIVEGADLYFERDEEGRYRAVLQENPEEKGAGSQHARRHPDPELLRLIAEKIESILA
ncbi:MAG TPA: hypothetical protein VNS58_25790 [Puia sp.]|jgi:hypothetical protein|nr:hypothetical protein [Puia sp.]